MTMLSQINAAGGTVANYIEDVFSTYLYTGNGSTQTITNNIDLSTKGGLVWIKHRTSGTRWHILTDSARGFSGGDGYILSTNATNAQFLGGGAVTGFTSTGFSLGSVVEVNQVSNTFASWTFRKQPKFFDVVTYTGTGSAQTINHNLGSVPGCMIIKRTDSSANWGVYHRSLQTTPGLENKGIVYLDLTNTVAYGSSPWSNTAPTATQFTVGFAAETNASGATYVAYLFAHDAGGFGLTGTDNVISCGSFTTDASANASVTLGYEPQFVLYKRSSGTSNWFMLDNMRGWSQSGYNDLKPNLSDAENATSGNFAFPTATGFDFTNSGSLSASSTYIYIAIRRGPMKTPTSGTSVYATDTRNAGSVGPRYTSGFPVDMSLRVSDVTDSAHNTQAWDRLRGDLQNLNTNTTAAETTLPSTVAPVFGFNTGIATISGATSSSSNDRAWMFQRAPSFMDVVCYTGTGSNTTVTHNLGAVPELIITKGRSNATNWNTYSQTTGNTKYLALNTTDAETTNTALWNSTTPTSSVFSLGTYAGVNGSGYTFVAYLFATCAGVSKVGSYTGTGTTQQINCGFTAGARFVLIKRTDSTGDWYVYDSARGIVAGNDPYLLLNSTAAEVTSTDYVDTYAAGFELSSTAPAALNASGGTFIFLAIA